MESVVKACDNLHGCRITSHLTDIAFCMFLSAFLEKGRGHEGSLSAGCQPGALSPDCSAPAGGTSPAHRESCPRQGPCVPAARGGRMPGASSPSSDTCSVRAGSATSGEDAWASVWEALRRSLRSQRVGPEPVRASSCRWDIWTHPSPRLSEHRYLDTAPHIYFSANCHRFQRSSGA